MRDIWSAVGEELSLGRSVCLATIVRQVGSAPRSVGTQFLVRRDGSIRGTIGGGRLEAEVTKAAELALEEGRAGLRFFRLMGKDVAQTEMICGGDVEVYLEPLRPDDQAGLEFLARAGQAVSRVSALGGRALMATLVRPGPMPSLADRRLLWTSSEGLLGPADDMPESWRNVVTNLEDLTIGRQPGLWPPTRQDLSQEIFFLEPIFNQPVVYICGGGHISLCLAPLARMVGFMVVVIDDRPEFADPQRFPMADQVWVKDFCKVFEGIETWPQAYVVIVTRGHLYDKEVLAQALERETAYVGMIGSRRKRQLIYQALEREGVAPERLAAVHSPIGLAIGAETPEEIAVSIVAELIEVRAGRPKEAGPLLTGIITT